MADAAPWWKGLLNIPAPPQGMGGLLGDIHNAIDPAQAFGGYHGLMAMALPPGAKAPGMKIVPPKTIGEGTAGRPSLDFRGADVFHYTDPEAAVHINKNGYQVVGNGYYGDAVSFTHHEPYAKNFGEARTVGRVAKDARILDTMNAADSEVIVSVLNDKRLAPVRSSARKGQMTWADRFKELGYDGLYDPGAGDLFIYNPAKVTPHK